MSDPSLLPTNQGAWTRALSEAIAERWDVSADALTRMWDASSVPEPALPYLASQLGVPLWLARWTVTRKRAVTAAWVALSRKRGTETAFRELLGYVDAELVEFSTPGRGITPHRLWTDAERKAWLSKHLEVRLYPFRDTTVRRGVLTTGQPFGGSRSILRRSHAAERAGLHAYLVKEGKETLVDVASSSIAPGTGRQRVAFALPTKDPTLTPGRALGPRFVVRRSTAAQRVFAYDDGAGKATVVVPGAPATMYPDKVAAQHVTRGGFAVGRVVGRTLRRSTAAEHVYTSLRIFDRQRAEALGPPQRGGWVLGRSHLRAPAFTLRLKVDAVRRRPGGFVVGRGLGRTLRSLDLSRVDEVLAAARAAKVGRDRVLVQTNLYRTITAGDAVPLDGSYRVGQVIRSI